MAKLPDEIQTSPTVAAIFADYAARQERRRSRRIGASIIGGPCDRKLWYDFRWCGREEFEGRMVRLFQSGHLEELRVVDNLRRIGCEVDYPTPETMANFTFTAAAGHFVCKIDAAVLGIPEAPKTWHVCEFKTASAKSFREIQKHGCLKAKPEHYAQCQAGMLLTGMDRALYLVVNKDTDDLYSERISFDKAYAKGLVGRAEKIARMATPPERIGDDGSKFPCSFCKFRAHCFDKKLADITCRSCVHATPITDGDAGFWRCEKKGRLITEQEQEKACDSHLFIPDLITFAEPVDAKDEGDEAWVEYKNPDGSLWRNGKGEGQYRSMELTVLPHSEVGRQSATEVTVDLIKQSFNAVVEKIEASEPTELPAEWRKAAKRFWTEGENANGLSQQWEEIFHERLPDRPVQKFKEQDKTTVTLFHRGRILTENWAGIPSIWAIPPLEVAHA